jgi:hypothetical protein
MATLAQSVVGTRFYISAGLPATYNAAGFQALSYTEIGEVTDGGSFGKTWQTTNHNPIASGQTYKFKTQYDNGDLTLQMARIPADAGQTILIAANNSTASYSIKVTVQDGTDMYFTGKITSYTTEIGAGTAILGCSVAVAIDSDIVETA